MTWPLTPQFANSNSSDHLSIRQEAALRIFCALTINSTYSADLRAKRSWEMADIWMAAETEKG